MSRSWLTVVLLTASSIAAAAPGRRVVVDVPAPAAPAAAVSHTIFLDRCSGGCNLSKSTTNNAAGLQSTIPQGTGPFHVNEYVDATGNVGTLADAEWAKVVQCVTEVYSPFDVTITDVKPTTGTYHVALVAGSPVEVGLGNDILGIAPLAGDCSAQDNVMSFTFANHHATEDRVNNVCWTIAQESAHAFGLDHEFMFVDGRSTCSDPMTYRTDCGGQRFYRNQSASCGEFAVRPCKCGTTQNSHKKLLSVFGQGTPITGNPTSEIVFPQPNAPVFPAVVAALAGSRRGISKVELRVNGFPWAIQAGLPFTLTGQMTPGMYSLTVPPSLPKGVADIVARAYDDLGATTDSATLTLTNGEACTTAATCAAHQKCETGRCFWDPAVGETGDACTYAQFCKSNVCTETSDGKYCSEPCTPEEKPSTCPDAASVCAQTAPGIGVCVPDVGGGCCSVGAAGTFPWPPVGFALLGTCWILRRRRGRSARFADVRGSGRGCDESC